MFALVYLLKSLDKSSGENEEVGAAYMYFTLYERISLSLSLFHFPSLNVDSLGVCCLFALYASLKELPLGLLSCSSVF